MDIARKEVNKCECYFWNILKAIEFYGDRGVSVVYVGF